MIIEEKQTLLKNNSTNSLGEIKNPSKNFISTKKLSDKKTSSTSINSSSSSIENSFGSKNKEKENILILPNSKISIKKKNNLNQSINNLKPFKTWSCSNLNAMYQNIIQSDKANYLNIKPNFNGQADITRNHRTILVDWLINVHLYFKLSDECLYLSVKLMDIFLARIKGFQKKKIQLLGICALQLSSKYIELVHPSIKDLTDLCDNLYTKNEIIELEKVLLQVNEYIIEQDQVLNFYDLLALFFQFNIKQYFFGRMLLDLTLLDVEFYQYPKNLIVFSVCYLVLINNGFMNKLEENFDIDAFNNNNGNNSDNNSNNNNIWNSKNLLLMEKVVLNSQLKEEYFQFGNNSQKNYYNKNGSNSCNINNNANGNGNIENYNEVILKVNNLINLYSKNDYFLIKKCAKEIISLFEKMKISKCNTAIQKFFIQLKEHKEGFSPSENSNEQEEEVNMTIES